MTKPIPDGHEGLIPHLVCSPCGEAIDFYTKAFGAEEVGRMPGPDGRLMHAAIRIDGKYLFLADDFPEYCGGKQQSPSALGGTPVTIHRYVNDCDDAIERAVKAGATVVMPAGDMFWGDRYGLVKDPFGHNWAFATHIKDMTMEETVKAGREAFANFHRERAMAVNGLATTPMSSASYLHGYDPAEQRRLIDQATFWSERLILPALDYRPGERLLDIGCGVGAVLGVIGQHFPGLELAGIDIEPRQIEAARGYLRSLGLSADLRLGDAARMPWPDGAERGFDHAYMMWFIEHLRDAATVLREVRRVLKPGGTVTIHETDYGLFQIWPPSRDWDQLERAQYEHFRRHGDAFVGRRLGILLHQAGFTHVRSVPVAFHHFSTDGTDELRAFTTYIAGFLEPAIPEFVRLGSDDAALRRGLAHLRALPDLPDGAITVMVYRARARAPGG